MQEREGARTNGIPYTLHDHYTNCIYVQHL